MPRRLASWACGLTLGLFALGLTASTNLPSACPTCVLDYPYSSSIPRTSIAFSESEILRAFSTNVAGRRDTIKVWYNDERALALGVRRVIVTTTKGSVTNDYPVTALTNNPGTALRPLVGTTTLTGDQAGTDLSDRPIFPALFVTDITTNQNSKAGDWQFGGTAIAPHAVFGTWKTVVRKVDKTRSPAVVTLLTDNDPAPNHWNLGSGDAAPAGAVDLGYGTEIRWNTDDLGLLAGHNYRLYFMMHDGDQNRAGGDVGHACLNITVVHRVPLAKNDAYSINEETTLAVPAPGVLANDTNVDGDKLAAILLSGTSHGAVALNPDGSFRYLPITNYNGPDSFIYKANDGAADSLPATVNITVLPVNDAPVAVNDTYSINEDTALLVAAPGVLANDTDVEGDRLTAILVSGPAHGSLTFNADGSFRYLGTANYNGPDSFSYKANDSALDSSPATVRITVVPVNDAPVAVNDNYSINEDTALSIAAPGVLANDTDVEGDRLTAILVSGPSHGTLTFNADGSFRYLGATNYNGPDSFTYKANDGALDSTLATVSITVAPVNDAPVAINDTYTINEDTALSIAAPGVLANDTDVEGDRLTAILVTGPTHGSLTFNANGSFRYLGAANYNGPDSFAYKANDGSLDSSPATVSITVVPVNDAPVAVNDTYSINEDTALSIAAPGVLANDTDVEGDRLTAILVSGPTHGSLTLNADGSFRYLGSTNYNGPDSFTYKANDGALDSSPATVSITVVPMNDAPVAVNDTYSINEDTALSIAAPGVLANDTDVEGDRLTAILVSGPAHGSLAFNADGSFRYLGATNYNGPDSFTYKANDGSLDSSPATVSITVVPVNDAPIAVNDAYSINEDTALSVAAPGVLANDTDVEGDRLTAILVSGPTHGSLTFNANGSFHYLGATNYNGPDSFTYKANDGALDSTPATVSITVVPVNDAPVAVNDAYSINEDTALSIAAPGVLANDTDVEGDRLTAILVSGPTHGSLTFNANGSFRYLGAANYNGPDSFTYKANDGPLDSTPATVSITVVPVNDAPIAVNDAYSINEDTALSIAAPGVLANDTDVEGDRLTAILVSGPTHGSLTFNPNGSFRYLGASNYNGPDSFTYKANDGALDSAPATVSLSVQPVNDPPSFTKGPDQLVNEDAGAQTVANWASNLSAGPPDEASQTLTFLVTTDTNALFSVQPAISPTGTLSYTPATHAYGIAQVTVSLRDDGGTANGGVDTSTAQKFVITVNAPPTVSIVEPTNNTIFIAPANIIVIADAHDVDGTVSEVQIFQGTSLLLQTNAAPYLTVWTNVLAGNYQFSAKATDNAGASTVSSPVNVTVLENPPLLVIQPPHFNPQTGLFEEKVRVLNPTPMTFSAVRVVVRDLAAGMQVFNGSGKTNGISYVQSNLPVLPGASVDMTIEYYVPNFQTPNPTLTAEVVGISAQAASLSATLAPVTRELRLGNGNFLMEFSSLASRIYFVQYSSDLKNWSTAWPSVAGTGNRIQWIDNGPPRTEAPPVAQPARFYRIVLAP